MPDARVVNAVNWDHPAAAHVKILTPHLGLVERTRQKVAIVGFASSSRDKAPFDDPEWEIWGLNQLGMHIPRMDRCFELHWNAFEPEVNVEGTDHRAWCREASIPVYLIDVDPEIPNSLRFPLEEIIEKFGADYFTSTISYMVALALYEGFKTIGIWGVDLIVGTEWFHQKACLEFWIGMANAMNVHIVLPKETALLKQTHRYGYEVEAHSGPISLSLIEKRMREASEQKAKAVAEMHTLDGLLQDLQYFRDMLTLHSRGGLVGPLTLTR